MRRMTIDLLDSAGEVKPMHRIQAEAVERVLALHKGDRSKAARTLRVSRGLVYRRAPGFMWIRDGRTGIEYISYDHGQNFHVLKDMHITLSSDGPPVVQRSDKKKAYKRGDA